MRCENCKDRIEYDLEGDLIHTKWLDKGCDPRMCNPFDPDSKIASHYDE